MFEIGDRVRHINGLPVPGTVVGVGTVRAGQQGKGRATVYYVEWDEGRNDGLPYGVRQLVRA